MYRQKMTGLDRKTLNELLNMAKRQWAVEEDEFPFFCRGVEEVSAGEGMNEYDTVENIERSSNGAKFLFYHIKRNVSEPTTKYDVVLCYLTANTEITRDIFIGGMMIEGYASTNGQDQLYPL